MQVKIREAVTFDGAAVLEMLTQLASFEGCPRRPGLDINAFHRDVLSRNPSLTIFVAEGLDGLYGFISTHATYSSWEGAPGCHIGDLWVNPDARHRGVGAALLKTVMARCRDQGARRIEVHVLRGNNALGFYEGLGFPELSEWSVLRKELSP